jgi:hypothetical protein
LTLVYLNSTEMKRLENIVTAVSLPILSVQRVILALIRISKWSKAGEMIWKA